MCRNGLFTGRGETGFSLISAIFLLVVLAGLGTFMLRFSTVQHLTAAQDAESARVYQLARAGADYGAYLVLQTNTCAASSQLSFPGGYAATIHCASAGPYAEPGGDVTVYTITSIACNRPLSGSCPGTADGLTYTERSISIRLAR